MSHPQRLPLTRSALKRSGSSPRRSLGNANASLLGWASCLLLASLLVACGGPPIADSFTLQEVQHPDLSSIEDAAREQLEAQRETLQQQLASATEARPLADAFGSMGELYHAYELFEPAKTSYQNAQILDAESFLWPYYLGVIEQRQGNFVPAIQFFKTALEKDPNALAAQHRQAQAQRDAGQLDAARQQWKSLAETDDGAAAHYQLGLLATEAGKPGQAVKHLEAALELAPHANRVHHALAAVHRERGHEAKTAYHEALAGDVDVAFEDRLAERLEDLAISSGAYLRRGNRALTAGNLDAAASAFRRAIQVNPDLADAHRNLALTHVQKKELDAALEVLREAVQLHPSDLWLRFDLGTTYMAKGLQEQAIEAFQIAVDKDPNFTQAHFNLANALVAREQWDDAKTHLDQVLEQDPDDGRARYLQAMALHKTGGTPQAIELLEQQVQDTPDDVVARQGLAQVYTDLKRDAEARRVFSESIARDTLPLEDRLDMSFQLAELEWRKRRRAEAIQVWRQAVKLDPKSSEARTALGNGLQLLNRWPEARQHFAKAVELDPANARAWRAETNLWILDKEFETASQRLDDALEVLPDDATLLNTAARLLSTCEMASVRDGERALEMARKAYNLENSLDHAETISMALAEVGEFEKAIQWQRRLLAQVQGTSDQRLLRRLATNLKFYENRRPIRTG